MLYFLHHVVGVVNVVRQANTPRASIPIRNASRVVSSKTESFAVASLAVLRVAVVCNHRPVLAS